MSATQPAAVGPPKLIAATIVAMDVLMSEPRGIRTGRAEATSVSAVQNATPLRMLRLLDPETASPIPGSIGITKLVMASATAPTVTSPAM